MSGQRKSLFLGVLIGLLVAAFVWLVRWYIVSHRSGVIATETSASSAPPPAPDVPAVTPDIGASVQLTDDEQKSIGDRKSVV